MTRTLVLAGGVAPYVDPWHPFAATSDRIVAMLTGLGHDVEVSTDPAERMRDLDGIDLLVSNSPMPSSAPGATLDTPVDPALLDAADASLQSFVARGGSILAFHVAVTTLLGLPSWSPLIGARWLPGQTMHPPLGPGRVRVHADARTGAAREFELHDEMYARLGIDAELDVLVSHEFEGAEHPLVWAREVDGTRVVADALGHGTESFDSPDHLDVLERSVRWLAHAN